MIFFICYLLFVVLTTHCLVFAENAAAKQNMNHSFSPLLKKMVSASKRRMDTLNAISRLEDYLTRINREDKESGEQTDTETDKQNQNGRRLDLVNNNVTARRSKNQKKPKTKETFVPIEKNRDENNVSSESKTGIKLGLKRRNTSKSENSMKNHNGNKIKVTDTGEEKKVDFEVDSRIVDTLVTNLRRNWVDTCSRKAAKVCKDACNTTYRRFCKDYSCSSRAKKKFKKECKINCKTKFQLNNYSAE